MRSSALGILLALLAGCAVSGAPRRAHSPDYAQPQRGHPDRRFTVERLAKVEVGMAESALRALFGYPDNVEIAVCRPEGEEPWDCKILWYYEGIESNAFCLEQVDGEEWVLNSYDIRFQD